MKKNIRVLIVEDSEDDMLLLVRHLKKAGFDPIFERVETAEDMKHALDSSKWDIILADYSMPRFSGLEALELLKASNLDIPFILVSGKVGEDTAVEAMIQGAQDYILKENYARLVPAIERELKEIEIHREKSRIEFDRQLTKEALKESEEIFQRLVESSPVGILIVDRWGKIRLANPQFYALMGNPPKEFVIGRKIQSFFVEHSKGSNPEFKDEISTKTLPTHSIITIQTEGGQQIQVDFHAGSIIWGGDPAYQVIVHPHKEQVAD